MLNYTLSLAEQNLIPDWLIRRGIRALLGKRLKTLQRQAAGSTDSYTRSLIEQLSASAVAEQVQSANQQHYEVPSSFFQSMLGPRLKYSACYFAQPEVTLPRAEEAMLQMTAQRAQLADGQQILELGCGWGSLTLWMAEEFPSATIVAVSNSQTQVAFVRAAARARGLRGVRVVKADINHYTPDQRFDRIVSVEMLEHVRNYGRLFKRMADWLKDDGRLFVHVFSHRTFPYLFEPSGPGDWMAREFFSGGTMPSQDLLPRVATGFQIDEEWRINGSHYARTLEAWLKNLDRRQRALRPLLGDGPDARRALQRWRMFLMACAELFGYNNGEEWGVSHYRFAKAPSPARKAWRENATEGAPTGRTLQRV